MFLCVSVLKTTERPTKKSIQERLAKLRREQRGQLKKLGILPEEMDDEWLEQRKATPKAGRKAPTAAYLTTTEPSVPADALDYDVKGSQPVRYEDTEQYQLNVHESTPSLAASQDEYDGESPAPADHELLSSYKAAPDSGIPGVGFSSSTTVLGKVPVRNTARRTKPRRSAEPSLPKQTYSWRHYQPEKEHQKARFPLMVDGGPGEVPDLKHKRPGLDLRESFKGQLTAVAETRGQSDRVKSTSTYEEAGPVIAGSSSHAHTPERKRYVPPQTPKRAMTNRNAGHIIEQLMEICTPKREKGRHALLSQQLDDPDTGSDDQKKHARPIDVAPYYVPPQMAAKKSEQLLRKEVDTGGTFKSEERPVYKKPKIHR